MARKTDFKVPFDPHTGDLQTYPQTRYKFHPEHKTHEPVEPVWKDNHEFEAVMQFEGFERGRSAAHAILRDQKDMKQYTMFLTDLAELINYGFDKEGVTHTEKWTFVKRGQNYGVRLAYG